MILLVAMVVSQHAFGMNTLGGAFSSNPIAFLLERLFKPAALTTNTKESEVLVGNDGNVVFVPEQFSLDESLELAIGIDKRFYDATVLEVLNDIVLRQKGNRVNAVDVNGNTPLHWACIFKNHDVIKFLSKNGARYDICDSDGNFPVHYISDSTTLELLCAEFGNEIINLKNAQKETLLDIVERHTDVYNSRFDRNQGFLEHARIEKKIEEFKKYASYLKSVGAKRASEL